MGRSAAGGGLARRACAGRVAAALVVALAACGGEALTVTGPGDGGAADDTSPSGGPKCVGRSCGPGERCEAATGDCVCQPGFVSDGTSGCVAAPADDPVRRDAQAVCARWRDGHQLTAGANVWKPGPTACDPGTLPAGAIADTLRRLDLYRWLAGLDDHVAADPAQSARDQLCAVGLSANGALSHAWPTQGWKCYTPDGAAAAGSSNEALMAQGMVAADAVDLFMDDPGAGNAESLGHRRWLLNPPLGPVGVGYGGGGALVGMCLYVFGATGAARATWTSYPSRGVVPLRTALSAWSLHSTSIDLHGATLTVTRASDGALLAGTVTHLGDGYGDKTALSFTPTGWSATEGVVYRVHVTGLPGGGHITYDVRPVVCL